eukprot:gene17935-biopygen9910
MDQHSSNRGVLRSRLGERQEPSSPGGFWLISVIWDVFLQSTAFPTGGECPPPCWESKRSLPCGLPITPTTPPACQSALWPATGRHGQAPALICMGRPVRRARGKVPPNTRLPDGEQGARPARARRAAPTSRDSGSRKSGSKKIEPLWRRNHEKSIVRPGQRDLAVCTRNHLDNCDTFYTSPGVVWNRGRRATHRNRPGLLERTAWRKGLIRCRRHGRNHNGQTGPPCTVRLLIQLRAF